MKYKLSISVLIYTALVAIVIQIIFILLFVFVRVIIMFMTCGGYWFISGPMTSQRDTGTGLCRNCPEG